MKISLIIATYNRGEQLGVTLDSLTTQTLPRSEWEVVVVNNNSTDLTDEVCARFAADNPSINFKVVHEPKQGLSYARNCGIENSTGAIVAIIDDDETIVPRFLELYVDFFDRHAEAAGAGGRIVPLYTTTPPRWLSHYTSRPIAGTLDLGGRERPFPEGRYFGGGNLAVRRSALERYGAFDPRLGRKGAVLTGGEEKDLYYRLKSGGEQIWYLPEATINHIIPPERLTRGYIERVSYRTGCSERSRTINISRSKYTLRLLAEVVKWGGTAVIALGFVVKGEPSKGGCMFVLRWGITRGLLGLKE